MDRAPGVNERFMSGWKGSNWVKRVSDEGRSGRPSTSRTQELPKSFFSTGIQKLVNRYNKCIVLQGDYVEK